MQYHMYIHNLSLYNIRITYEYDLLYGQTSRHTAVSCEAKKEKKQIVKNEMCSWQTTVCLYTSDRFHNDVIFTVNIFQTMSTFKLDT